jgi:uncharacterized membrane protein (DUF485 family)
MTKNKVVVKDIDQNKKFEDLVPEEEELFRNAMSIMTFADLHAMFVFVSGDFNKQFGVKLETKKIVHARHKMILEELNRRAYGGDPYEASKLEVEGDKPEDVDLSQYEEKESE